MLVFQHIFRFQSRILQNSPIFDLQFEVTCLYQGHSGINMVGEYQQSLAEVADGSWTPVPSGDVYTETSPSFLMEQLGFRDFRDIWRFIHGSQKGNPLQLGNLQYLARPWEIPWANPWLWKVPIIASWLVVWLPCFIFPYIGNIIIPIDELIFFRWVAKNHQPARLAPPHWGFFWPR